MDSVDLYTLLGLSPAAGDDELRQVYRLAARRFHPDVNRSPGAASLFRDISAAYEVLGDPRRRHEYDALHQQDVPHSLQIQAHCSRRQIKRLDEPQLLYVLVKILPLSSENHAGSAPLNLCLVVDRSTSMKGARLQYVKLAAQRIIDQCRPEDILSLVTFSDRAEPVITARRVTDPLSMKSLVSTIRADGATAILAGLRMGLAQIERHRHPHCVNHLVLITDGRTYGDEDECVALAQQACENGVGISCMGIGEDWNDSFLDRLASVTGGSSVYASSAGTVTRFLHERLRDLAAAYAARTWLNIAPAPGVELSSAVRLSPSPIELDGMVQPLPLGTLDGANGARIVLQFHLQTTEMAEGELFVARLDAGGEVLGADRRPERLVEEITVTVARDPVEDDPPPELLDALGRLMLYRLQDRAREAVASGDIGEASRKLETLATRLFELGEDDLGQAALEEAERVAQSQRLSEEGAKQLKYGTRALLPLIEDGDHDQVS
jgi:Ca-activated chloride channel family protein